MRRQKVFVNKVNFNTQWENYGATMVTSVVTSPLGRCCWPRVCVCVWKSKLFLRPPLPIFTISPKRPFGSCLHRTLSRPRNASRQFDSRFMDYLSSTVPSKRLICRVYRDRIEKKIDHENHQSLFLPYMKKGKQFFSIFSNFWNPLSQNLRYNYIYIQRE